MGNFEGLVGYKGSVGCFSKYHGRSSEFQEQFRKNQEGKGVPENLRCVSG